MSGFPLLFHRKHFLSHSFPISVLGLAQRSPPDCALVYVQAQVLVRLPAQVLGLVLLEALQLPLQLHNKQQL